MAVPDTNTFSLQDVINEVNPTSNDLVDCFSDANAVGFDPAYEQDKDELNDFRNYTSVVLSWLISDMTVGGTADISSYVGGATEPSQRQPAVDQGGTRVYVPSPRDATIRQMSLATANDVTSSKAAVGTSSALSYAFIACAISSDGTKMIIVDWFNYQIQEHSLSTAWDITTMSTTPTTTLTIPSTPGVPYSISFSLDGLKMTIICWNPTTGPWLVQWSLTTGWDLSTAGTSTSSNIDTSADSTSPKGLFQIVDAGSDVYVAFGPAGNYAYADGITDSDIYDEDHTVGLTLLGSANSNDYVYALWRDGVNGSFEWNLVQWDTNV